jgi:hypothetical protein
LKRRKDLRFKAQYSNIRAREIQNAPFCGARRSFLTHSEFGEQGMLMYICTKYGKIVSEEQDDRFE